jgi:membrane-bound lytic murein transglycosylase MltF
MLAASLSAFDPKRTWPKDRNASGWWDVVFDVIQTICLVVINVTSQGTTMTAPCCGWSKTGFAMLGPTFWRCVQPWFFAALVGLCYVGQPNGVQAADDEKTALPAFAPWIGDFDGMQQRRQIRLIVPYSKTIFFIDKGDQWGTAAEWGDELDKWLNKGKKSQLDHIQIDFVPTPRAEVLSALNQGRGDIVLANLTITNELLEKVDFTDPALKNVREILVTSPSAPAIGKVEDLSGEKIYVRKSSSYFEHLVALNESFASRGLKGIELIPADEELEDEDLLEMVNAGIFPFIVVDDYVAQVWAKLFKSIRVRNDIVINDKGAIAGAIRKDSPLLKTTLNRFLQEKATENEFANWLRYRYYTNEKMALRAYAPEDIGRFNGLVNFFKRYGDQYGFDYLMIAAQGYQESALDQSERSKAGAVGVMQMKPSTAREPYIAVDGIEDSAERNIESGNKYLRYIITKYLDDPALDAKNQTLLAFAAYNAGPTGLQRFRDRAKAMGLNPNVWFGNVENAAAAIVGRETVQYVSNIYKYYIAYTVMRQMEENEKARKAVLRQK